eukprot:TRINITY_DN5318_c0_g1_i1.p2 TRINITY_DN5318_c0_g1~~TRINITY_DN5318_c0_g1_i1.p2  ORF type:complete len:115 (+),score=26.37 TRINITY_DN5318_c0_g1_i1:60-404(+)
MAQSHIIYQGSASCLSFGAWWNRTIWTITDVYIERQTGTCCQTIDNLQLIRVKDISYKGASCCCEECGEIKILSNDVTDPELIITGISNSQRVYEQIRDAWDKRLHGAQIEVHQ